MKRGTKLALTAVAGLIMFVSGVALAFKPDKHTFGHTMITESVLSERGYSYGGGYTVAGWTTKIGESTQRFSKTALDDVILGVQATDFAVGWPYSKDGVNGWLYPELWTEEAHCDNDLIGRCSERIIRIKQSDVVGSLKAYLATKDKFHVVNARVMLGRALHTLQDFYAHSTYSNNHPGAGFYAALTSSSDTVQAALPSSSVATCVARSEPINSTWATNGGNFEFTPDGASAAVITSGYFFNSYAASGFGSAPDKAAVRCDHGMELARATVSGINKDAPYSPFAPAPYYSGYTTGAEIANAAGVASPLHLRASFHAAAHSARFLDEVVAEIRSSTADPAEQDEMVAALLGVETPVIGFVIDDTGSMSDIISGVKANIQRTIDNAVAARQSTKFLVLSYGDPDVGSATIGTAEQVKSVVASIYASGGGDCPELTQSGLLAALKAAPVKSKLLVFTDASSKDADLQPQVEKLALEKEIVISYSVSGTCSDSLTAARNQTVVSARAPGAVSPRVLAAATLLADPTYYKTAAATGGQVLVTEHTAAAVEAAFLGVSIESDGFAPRPTVIEQGTLNGVRNFSIPVNADATGFSVTATFGNGSLALFDPSGAKVVAGAAGVDMSQFIGGQGYAVKSPAAGVWRAELTTQSDTPYTVNAAVTSALDLNSVKFFTIDEVGRAGHESSMPFLDGPPPGNVKLDVSLTDIDGVTAKRFELIGPDGAVVSTAAMTALGRGFYSGTVTAPAAPFRVRVSGTDGVGKDFVRIAPALVTPIRYALALPEHPTWVAGHANTLRVQLTNYGDAATFQLSATFKDAPATVSAPALTVAKGATGETSILINVPAGSAEREELAISVIVDGVTQVSRVPLSIEADSDGDGIADREESGPSGGNPNYDGNGDGVPDRLQPNVISLRSRQGAAYFTASIDGPGKFADARAFPAPAAAAGAPTFPLELIGYRITGLSSGGATQVVLRMPAYLAVGDFKLYTTSASADSGKVIDFSSDGSTGASASANIITVKYVDGQRGDADGGANGEISTLGGPARVDINGVNHEPGAQSPESRHHRHGGGCTTGGSGKDGSLAILTIIAGAMVWKRRRK